MIEEIFDIANQPLSMGAALIVTVIILKHDVKSLGSRIDEIKCECAKRLQNCIALWNKPYNKKE
jgi:hypothetical protein